MRGHNCEYIVLKAMSFFNELQIGRDGVGLVSAFGQTIKLLPFEVRINAVRFYDV